MRFSLPSGGTEASNHALKGAVFCQELKRGPCHIITSAIEHPATLKPCAFLKSLGCQVTILPVDRHGPGRSRRRAQGADAGDGDRQHHARQQRSRHFAADRGNQQARQGAWRPDAHRRRAVTGQGAGQCARATTSICCRWRATRFMHRRESACYSSGAGSKLESLLHGAGHEEGRRAGTENVPYIVGLGKACEIARQSLPGITEKLSGIARAFVAAPFGSLGRTNRVERPSRRALAQHAQRQLSGARGCRFIGARPGDRRVHGIGLP